jgi:hypothetical protein
MKNIIAVCAFFALTGCSTVVPVKAKFPDMPERLMIKCPQLEKVSETPTLSDVAKTITNNYTTYYECATKHDGFVEWYNIQKEIFNKVQ